MMLPDFLRRPLAAMFVLGLAACGGGDGPPTEPEPEPQPTTTPLRDLFAPTGRRIGVAVGSDFNQNNTYMTTLRREFNMITAENAMKFDALHPSRTTYQWATADAIVAFAEQNGMQVRGHTLIWHQQNPQWLTTGTWTPAEAQAIMNDHITTVVGRYRGRIAAWDVVNEAVDDTGRRRNSVWQNTIGRDYIEQAFRAADAADPSAALYYNDYSLEWPGPKQDSVYAMLADFKARGVPVDGIGFQGHFIAGSGTPSRQTLKATFDRFAALGLKIQITELDVRIPLPSTPEKLATQAANYRDVVSVCLDTPACDAVVVWGLYDGNSWVPSTFPGYGDALLFDTAFKPKPAYQALNDLLSGK